MEAARDLNLELRSLADQLTKSPFCVQYSLEMQSLAKVNQFVEQKEGTGDVHVRQFKALWCLFLMQLEQIAPVGVDGMNRLTLQHYTSGTSAEPLEEITRTGALSLAPPPPAEPASQDDNSDKTVHGDIINFIRPSESPAGPTVRESIVLVLGAETQTATSIALPIPTAEPAPVTPVPAPVVAPPQGATPIPTVEVDEEPDIAPLTPMPVGVPVVEETVGDLSMGLATLNEMPEADTAPYEVLKPVPVETPRAARSLPTVEEVPDTSDWALPSDEERGIVETPAPTATLPTSDAANEYYALALYFRRQRAMGGGEVSEAQWTRLEAQQVCFAIELELQDRLAHAIPAFWPRRKTHLMPLWDPSSPRGDFHAALLRKWDEMAKTSPIWPSNEKLPLMSFKNSLRFVALAPDTADAKLSPLEAGLWLYLFGQSAMLGNLRLNNALGLPAFDPSTMANVFLRLCRVHRMKSLLSKPSSVITETDRQEIEEHAEALFTFTNQWARKRS